MNIFLETPPLLKSLKHYTLYEGLNLSNKNSRKLVVFDRKLEGSHSLYYGHFAKYQRVMMH